MNEVTKEFIARVRVNPLWADWMAAVREHQPVVPEYRPGQSQEETFALLEQIKFASGRKEGFELAMRLITEK